MPTLCSRSHSLTVQMYGGMRGIKALVTETSLLDPEEVRGQEASGLLSRLTLSLTHTHTHTHRVSVSEAIAYQNARRYNRIPHLIVE